MAIWQCLQATMLLDGIPKPHKHSHTYPSCCPFTFSLLLQISSNYSPGAWVPKPIHSTHPLQHMQMPSPGSAHTQVPSQAPQLSFIHFLMPLRGVSMKISSPPPPPTQQECEECNEANSRQISFSLQEHDGGWGGGSVRLPGCPCRGRQRSVLQRTRGQGRGRTTDRPCLPPCRLLLRQEPPNLVHINGTNHLNPTSDMLLFACVGMVGMCLCDIILVRESRFVILCSANHFRRYLDLFYSILRFCV